MTGRNMTRMITPLAAAALVVGVATSATALIHEGAKLLAEAAKPAS